MGLLNIGFAFLLSAQRAKKCIIHVFYICVSLVTPTKKHAFTEYSVLVPVFQH